MSQIISPKYLESLRSSDYKNSIYAFAEIIDNSIDAEASEVEVIFLTHTVHKQSTVTDIFFIDNGKGIKRERLNKIIIFSESGNIPGDNSNKTGRFGVGLPNSSFSQTKNFSVASAPNGNWSSVSVDLKKMISENTLDIPEIIDGTNDKIEKCLGLTKVNAPKTIIHWSKPDQLDFNNPKLFFDKFEPIIGRVYRYFLASNKNTIHLTNFENQNDPFSILVRPLDPLFLLTGPAVIYDALIEDIRSDRQGDIPDKRPKEFLKNFVNENEKIVLPLYQKLESHCHDNIKVKLNGKVYKLKLTSSYAYKDIQKPGMESPGGILEVGKSMRKKMIGGKYGPGGNISWIRNGREIECGNYNLFTVSEEKNRWWSIEISYETGEDTDNTLDKLLGLSNTKQSYKFKAVSDATDINSETNSESAARNALMNNITVALTKAIRDLRKRLADQASSYKREIEPETEPGGFPGAQAGTQRVLRDALGPGEQLTDDEQATLVNSLARFLPSVAKNSIEIAVRKYSEIGIQNIPIYCQLSPHIFFESQNFQGRVLTLINTEHSFYKKIIQPLKDKGSYDLVISLELLLSNFTKSSEEAIESHKTIIESHHNKVSGMLNDMLALQDQLIPNTLELDDEDE
jgi:hypothetical protein